MLSRAARLILGLSFFATAISCKPRTYNDGSIPESAAVPGPNECLSPDPYAITGKNTKTGACVPLNEFRVLNHLNNNLATNGYIHTSPSYAAFASRYGFRTDVTHFDSVPMIANVRHDSQFWVAQIDLTQVSAVYFQVEEFKIPIKKDDIEKNRTKIEQAIKPLRAFQSSLTNQALGQEIEANINKLLNSGEYYAAHGQIRVKFRKPVLLGSHADPKVRTSVSSLVFSVHAVAENYDPVEGLSGAYPLALGVYSASEKFNNSVVKFNNPIREYKLKMSANELRQFATSYFNRALNDYRNQDYNTFFANCGNIPFETIEKSFYIAAYPSLFQAAKNDKSVQLGRNYPKFAQYALKAYGLLEDPNNLQGTPWKTLEQGN